MTRITNAGRPISTQSANYRNHSKPKEYVNLLNKLSLGEDI